MNGIVVNNVLYLELIVDRLKELTYPEETGADALFVDEAHLFKNVRNVVAQGKSDKLTEIDRQKSLRNKNELLELKSRNQGRITLATQKQH